MKKERQPIAIYSRKSKYTGKGESVENQVEMCRQHVAALYGQEAADSACVYEDEGYSGGNLERPQFKKMMRDAKELHFRAIVVYRLDRISRNIGDFAGLIEKLQAEHVDFISIREQFDTNSPMGRAMMYICSVFSQLERETIAERIRDNMYELSKTGRWLGGNTPTGYESESVTNINVDGKTKKACKLKVIPEEIQLVKLIYSKFMEFNSLTKTEQYLLVNGYKSKRGNEFTRFAIRALLTNPVYMIADKEAYEYLKDRVNLFSEETEFDGVHGVMAYNRTLQQRGKTQQLKPMEEWIVSVGKHEGVISGGDWVKVQKLLEMNKPLGYRKSRSHTALLSGLLVCGDCGEYMRPKMSQRTNGVGEHTYSYLCARKEKSRSELCKIKNPGGNQLDAMVVDEVKKLAEDKNELMKQLERNRKLLQGNMGAYDGELAHVKALMAENETSIKSLVNALPKAAETAAEAHIIAEIDRLHGQGARLKKQLQELEALTKQHELADVEFDLMAQMLSSFAANVDKASVEEKRALLRTLVKKVVWDGENVTAYLFGTEGTAVLPDEPLGEGSK